MIWAIALIVLIGLVGYAFIAWQIVGIQREVDRIFGKRPKG